MFVSVLLERQRAILEDRCHCASLYEFAEKKVVYCVRFFSHFGILDGHSFTVTKPVLPVV